MFQASQVHIVLIISAVLFSFLAILCPCSIFFTALSVAEYEQLVDDLYWRHGLAIGAVVRPMPMTFACGKIETILMRRRNNGQLRRFTTLTAVSLSYSYAILTDSLGLLRTVFVRYVFLTFTCAAYTYAIRYVYASSYAAFIPVGLV